MVSAVMTVNNYQWSQVGGKDSQSYGNMVSDEERHCSAPNDKYAVKYL